MDGYCFRGFGCNLEYCIMETIIKVSGLTKRFREVTAVDNLSFTVERGETYGFLGQNGAGKSTTIRMLLTLVEPTNGRVEIFGKELKTNKLAILKATGAVIEKPDLYKFLTALENLSIFARLSGLRLSSSALMKRLERVGLAERANSKVRTYSQGMKQRLGIAVALVHDPELIILDEPANGLDPKGIADMRNLILHLSHDLNKTVLVSSHLLSEIEQIADRLLIIDKGRKIVEGRISELLDPSNMLLELNTSNNEFALHLIKQTDWINSVKSERNKLVIQLHQRQIPQLIRLLVERNVDILSVGSKHLLEDFFLSLTRDRALLNIEH